MAPDPKMKELLDEMTRQPTPHLKERWVLRYVPPKHLRLPDYDYGTVEDSEASDIRNMGQANAGFPSKRRSAMTPWANEVNDHQMGSGLASPSSFRNLQDLGSSLLWYSR